MCWRTCFLKIRANLERSLRSLQTLGNNSRTWALKGGHCRCCGGCATALADYNHSECLKWVHPSVIGPLGCLMPWNALIALSRPSRWWNRGTNSLLFFIACEPDTMPKALPPSWWGSQLNWLLNIVHGCWRPQPVPSHPTHRSRRIMKRLSWMVRITNELPMLPRICPCWPPMAFCSPPNRITLPGRSKKTMWKA